MQVGDLGDAGVGEGQAVADLAFGDVQQAALDDVADVLHVDRELDDLGPAPGFAGVERLAADLCQVALDRGIQAVDLVVAPTQRFGKLRVVGAQHGQQAVEHVLHGVGQPDRFARGIAERQRRCGQRDRVEIARLSGAFRAAYVRQPALGEPCHAVR